MHAQFSCSMDKVCPLAILRILRKKGAWNILNMYKLWKICLEKTALEIHYDKFLSLHTFIRSVALSTKFMAIYLILNFNNKF